MARRAAPYYVRPRDGFAHLDATIAGKRIRESLGVPYPDRPTREEDRLARAAAAKRYAELVNGRTTKPHVRITTAATLKELLAMWLIAIETPTNKGSVRTATTYSRTFLSWAENHEDHDRWKADDRTSLERLVDDAGPVDFAMYRLSQTLRKTVRKELTALFGPQGFFAWAKRKHHLASIPPRPELPRGETGVRSGKQRSKPTDISRNEAVAFLAALPEWSTGRRGGEGSFRVRAPLELAWETSLRPSTIVRLEVPRNWKPGMTDLSLDDADDKVRYGRVIPLSSRAKRILEDVAPKEGLIFGKHDFRSYVEKAAKKALGGKAGTFAPYDLRHGRATDWLDESQDMLGVAYLMGHKQLTTTNAYLRGQRKHAQRVLASADAVTYPSRASAEASSDSPEGANFPTISVGASGFEPPTPRPPAERFSRNPGEFENGVASTNDRNIGDALPPDHVLARICHARALEDSLWASFDELWARALGIDVGKSGIEALPDGEEEAS